MHRPLLRNRYSTHPRMAEAEAALYSVAANGTPYPYGIKITVPAWQLATTKRVELLVAASIGRLVKRTGEGIYQA